MRITFTQSGGFAGLVKGCRIDTAALGPEERRELEALVEGSGLEASGERFAETGRDLRHYEITIEREAGPAVRLTCDEQSLPAAAAPLVHWLATRARPQPPR
jgi:hypothetical protein